MSLSILAIETCSEICSVALTHEGVQNQQLSVEPRGHADNVLPLVDGLIKQAGIALTDLDAIAFTRGPGAFTGVRIGTSVAQGIALAAELPVIAISSLAVLAQSCYRETQHSSCIAALDARMSEVYVGFYQLDEQGCMQITQDDQVSEPSLIHCDNEQTYSDNTQCWQGYGAGWTHYLQAMSERFKSWNTAKPVDVFYPQAIDLLTLAEQQYRLGNLLDPAEAMPVYVRDNVVRS